MSRHLGAITSYPRWALVFHEIIGNLLSFFLCTLYEHRVSSFVANNAYFSKLNLFHFGLIKSKMFERLVEGLLEKLVDGLFCLGRDC